jgi:peptide/nickel transport system permease protein
MPRVARRRDRDRPHPDPDPALAAGPDPLEPRVSVFLLRRLVQAATVLLAVSVVTFLIFFLVPVALGADPASLFAGRVTDPRALHDISIKLGLNHSLARQYLDYLGGFFHARHFDSGPDRTLCPWPCLGFSFRNELPVNHLIADRAPVTVSLALGASLLWVALGVTIGVVSALRPRTLADRASMVGALTGISLPTFFVGAVLQLVFVYTLHWLDPVVYVPISQNPVLWAENLILPWFTIAFFNAATYARFVRASMLDTLTEDYIRTARAKGLKESLVIRRHALRSVLTTIVTLFGLDLGAVLGGAVFTESAFGLPGLGKLGIDAIAQHDLPIIMGVTLVSAFFIVTANIVVDVLYAAIDPRVRLG